MNRTRTIVVSLVLAAGAFAPASALAKHGADDNPAVPDNHGAAQRADDHPGDHHRGRHHHRRHHDHVGQDADGAGHQ